MKKRLLVAAGAVALSLSCASSIALSATNAGAPSSGLAVALCDDGGRWFAVAVPVLSPADAIDAKAYLSLTGVGSVLPSNGCFELVLDPFDGAVVPDPGDVLAQDAAVWSRQGPVTRASDLP